MTLTELVAGASALLLDFDGPVCCVFAGYPAPVVAAELRKAAEAHIDGIPPEIDSPHTLYIWCATKRPDLAGVLDDFLTEREEDAVMSARPTDDAQAVIRAAASLGLPVTVASNNAASAIRKYLQIRSITEISFVCGRPHADPTGMKPNPRLLLAAAEELAVPPTSCVFVGDATTDMEASVRAATLGVGYAKSPHRRAGLVAAGAVVIVAGMDELLVAIRARA